MAHSLSRQTGEPYEDLLQTGFLGLIRAIERFDPDQNRALSSFALPYIRGAVLHYLRDRAHPVRLPRIWQELQARSRREQGRLRARLGRPPREAEVAAALGVSLKDLRACCLAVQQCQPLSLDAPLSHPEAEPAVTLGETLPAPRTMDPEVRLWLDSALEQLEDRTRQAIAYVYDQDWSRREAAAALGISPMTVTRHLQKGLGQLSQLLAA